MAEQVLDGSQVASPSQKMGGERMAERVRRRGFGQAERAAHPRHRQLHDARRQRAAFRADEQRAGRLEDKGAERQIILDRLAHRSDDRRRAGLLALADDRDGVRFRRPARRLDGSRAPPRCAGPRRNKAPAPRRRAPRPRARAPRLPAKPSWSWPSRPARSTVGAGDGWTSAHARRRGLRLFARFRARYGGRAI